MERYAKQIEPLKKELKILLTTKTTSADERICLIDAVERLGVSYYYETEINEQLDEIFEAFAANGLKNQDYDLYNTALHFRIFRQHGYHMPSDIFTKFTGDDGKFRETLKSDTKGMMSLYEAAHLRIHGENILDDALVWTTDFLKSIKPFSKQASYALEQPLHFRIPRVDTQNFICFYEEDDKQSQTLLQLAKLDYNRLQLIYRQELRQSVGWWKDNAAKLSYAKQRSVELHFSSIAMFFEPQYSLARLLLFKTFTLITRLDDTYDSYGTYEELRLLTEAFERWDLSSLDQSPTKYLKSVFEFATNTLDEFAKETTKRGKPYDAELMKDRLMYLIYGYSVEAKWVKAGYFPAFEEYMAIARITTCSEVFTSAFLMGMDEIADVKPFGQIIQSSKAIEACEVIPRLMDDIATHKEKQARRCVASGVDCYMKEFDMTREVVQIFNKMIEDAWKDLNEELLRKPSPDDLPKSVIKRLLNFARACHTVYKVTDGYTYSAKVIKDDIIATYAQPFSI